jgi:hypothetical protein
MAKFEYRISEQDRVCRLCGKKIDRGLFGIVLLDCHISAKILDLHFHEQCFFESLETAKENYTDTIISNYCGKLRVKTTDKTTP